MEEQAAGLYGRGSNGLNRTDKSAVIERLRGLLIGVPAIVVTDFHGLHVQDATELRAQLRAVGVHYEVVKNSLIRQAVVGTKMETMVTLLKGNTAIAFHSTDPSAAAKVLRNFVKTHDKLKLKGGWLEGKVLDEKGILALADLPGRNELRSSLLSVAIGVPTKFVRTLIAGPTTFARVLQARKQQLEG